MKKLAYIVAVVVSFIFGFSFLFTKGALDNLQPYQLLAFRFLIAALAMTLLQVLGAFRVDLKGKPIWGALLLAFFEPVLYFIGETAGIKLTNSSEAGLMISLIPVVVAIMAAFFLKEMPSLLQSVFIAISVGGVLFIALGGQSLSFSGHALGLLALGLAVLSAGGFSIMSRYLSSKFTPFELTYIMLWTGAIAFVAFALVRGAATHELSSMVTAFVSTPAWLSVLYLSILSSVVAYFGLNFVLARIEATQSAVIANLVTVISVVAGVVFRHEPFLWYHMVGGALILAGVWGTNRYAPRRDRDVETELSEIPQG